MKKTGKWGTTYDYEPLALFDGATAPAAWNHYTYQIENLTIGGVSSANYNFRTNAYVVNYAAHYLLNKENYWPSKRFTKSEDLTKSSSGIFGQENNYVNVYYTKAEPEEHYHIDVKYDTSALEKLPTEEKKEYPLVVRLNGLDYQVRIANKADVYDDATFQAASGNTSYPGADLLNGTYTYGAIKSGFESVEINGGTYYKTNIEDTNYLYVVDSTNQFYKGNRVYYNYLSEESNKKVGYDGIEAFLEQYQTDHGNESQAGEYDDRYAGAYIYNNGFSSVMYEDGTYKFTFRYKQTYTVTYKLGETNCSQHVYTEGQSVPIGCIHIPDTRDGYSIVWYSDGLYTTPATSFTINENTTLYGRYEKDTLNCHAYISYQLANSITLDGQPVSYITAANVTNQELLDSGKLVKNPSTNPQTTELVSFVNGAGKTENFNATVDRYFYDGELVLIDQIIPCLSFGRISLDYTADKYQKDGFYFDSTNTGNQLSGYCQTGAISLSAFYARDKYSVEIVRNNTKAGNAEVLDVVFGQKVTLTKPEKPGYAFDGWTWKKWDATAGDGSWVDYTWAQAPAQIAGESVEFKMPALKLQATANWKPGTFTKTITHYYQGKNETYDTQSMEAIKNATSTQGQSIQYEGNTYTNGILYYNNTTLVGASIGSADNKLFFSEYNEGKVETTSLIAAQTTMTGTTGTELQISDYDKEDSNSIFTYSFSIYQNGTQIKTLHGTDKFIGNNDMQLDYYYTRVNNLQIRTAAKATDNLDSGVTLLGETAYYYGETVSLKATLSAGYAFKGWYKAEDVLQEYTAGQNKALSSYLLKTSLDGVTPVCTTETYAFVATENSDLIAVTEPLRVAEASVRISGATEYTYGYAASVNNALTALVTITPGEDANATYVVGYQWYEGTDKIVGAPHPHICFQQER